MDNRNYGYSQYTRISSLKKSPTYINIHSARCCYIILQPACITCGAARSNNEERAAQWDKNYPLIRHEDA